MNRDKLRTLLNMFFVFFRIGAFTIGGGYAMLPIIQREVVDKNRWVSEEEIVDVFAIVQSVPGVIAINTSIFIGYKIGGMPGAVAAALGVILPSFITILAIAYLLFNIGDNIVVRKAFTGVRAGVVALIGIASFKLARTTIRDKTGVFLAVAAFIAMVFFDIHAALVIIAGALVGLLIYKVNNRKK